MWQKLKGCSERFLKHELNWLGLLPEDQNVEGAVVKRAPFCEAFPDTVASKYLRRIVAGLERYMPPVPATATPTPAS